MVTFSLYLHRKAWRWDSTYQRYPCVDFKQNSLDINSKIALGHILMGQKIIDDITKVRWGDPRMTSIATLEDSSGSRGPTFLCGARTPGDLEIVEGVLSDPPSPLCPASDYELFYCFGSPSPFADILPLNHVCQYQVRTWRFLPWKFGRCDVSIVTLDCDPSRSWWHYY